MRLLLRLYVMFLVLCGLIVIFAAPLHADGRIVTLPDTAPRPAALIQSIDLAGGVIVYQWQMSDGTPTDSGNSIARFTPRPDLIDQETGDITPATPLTDAEIVAAILAPEPTATLTQSIETVLGRLSDAEFTALVDSADVRVRRFIKIAEMRGQIRSDHPDTLAAVQLLDALDIIAAERWPTLLAP